MQMCNRKSQIALEYAYRRKEKTSCSVYWINASTEAGFTASYRDIAKEAGLSSDLMGLKMLQAVHNWLEKQPNWMMILNNVDELSLFHQTPQNRNLLEFIPQISGTIRWTSRDGSIMGKLVGKNDGIRVDKISLLESPKLLKESSHG